MVSGGEMTVPERIDLMIQSELSEASLEGASLLEAFQSARCKPHEITVNFSGGITQRCWRVTRSDGDYSVVYMPLAGYFALCVDSDFGPLDIGVHGPALGCFGSV